MTVRPARVVLIAVTAAVVLAGWGGAPPPTASPTSTPAPVSADHAPADVTFAQMMIPHHQQAVTMSAPAATHAASPQVRDLAARIQQEQSPEIDRMTAMLAAWGAPAPSGMSPGMPGMMSDADMSRLAAESGPVYDQDFLTMMIAHHSGAVTMARTELTQGRNPQARDLAASIITAQQAEITQMQALSAGR